MQLFHEKKRCMCIYDGQSSDSCFVNNDRVYLNLQQQNAAWWKNLGIEWEVEKKFLKVAPTSEK
jgi:hypothetical protein